MEKTNPLEDIREEILRGKALGYIDEFSQIGISNELLCISDALDDYCGIVRDPPKESSFYLPNSRVFESLLAGSEQDERIKKRVSTILILVNRVREPLQGIREKLGEDNSFYLSLSSTIVSIVLRVPIASLNSYQKPSPYDYRRYSVISGVDTVLQTIVVESYKAFDAVKDFDMTAECREYYEKNKDTLYSIIRSINQVSNSTTRKASTTTESSNGCMVAALVISTSLIACLCGVVMVLI